MECTRCGGSDHNEANCDLFPEVRLEHPDAEPGAAGPHMAGVLDVEYKDGVVTLSGLCYKKGQASGAGCNCLIDTIRQKLDITADPRAVRSRLQLLFPRGPDKVTKSNFLDFRAHWAAIVRILGEVARPRPEPRDPADMQFVCADLEYVGHGDIVGAGLLVFHIARVHTNHFVPLLELR